MEGYEALLLLGAAVGLYYYNLQRSAGFLNFFPGNVTAMSFEGSTPVASADLLIQNTSNVDFTINSLSANVYIDGTLVGNVSDFTPILVPANSENAFPLKIRFLLLTIIQDVISAFQTGSYQKTLHITGSVNANGNQAGLDLTYTV
jgi:hypothetical protein